MCDQEAFAAVFYARAMYLVGFCSSSLLVVQSSVRYVETSSTDFDVKREKTYETELDTAVNIVVMRWVCHEFVARKISVDVRCVDIRRQR